MFISNIFQKFFSFLFVLFITAAIYADQKKVAIIVPLEHAAMTEIILGIKESLKDIDAEIIVKNAHADSNIPLVNEKLSKKSASVIK